MFTALYIYTYVFLTIGLITHPLNFSYGRKQENPEKNPRLLNLFQHAHDQIFDSKTLDLIRG